MGKTPKPLTILVHPGLMDTPEIRTLAKKGHTIKVLPVEDYEPRAECLDDYDLVLGPNCWRMTPELLQYLDLAIKGARGVKYPRKEKV